jgi:hypothetical protein
VTDPHSLPPDRDLPVGRFAVRRDHLLREVEASGARGETPRRVRLRHVLVAVAAVIAAATAAPALGFGHGLFGFLDSDPRVPGIVANRVQKLVSVPTPAGEASLWFGPTEASGRCVFLHIGGAPKGTQPTPNGGSQCDVGPSAPQTLPIATNLTWYPANGTFTLLVDGRAAPGSGIARVVLKSSVGTKVLTLASGYFLADVATAAQGQLPADGRPYILIGYDKGGQEISRVDLQRLAANAGP